MSLTAIKRNVVILEKKMFFFRYNLKIMGLIMSDTALFQCVASNAAGNVQAAAYLKVIDTGKLFIRITNKYRQIKGKCLSNDSHKCNQTITISNSKYLKVT